MKHVLLLRLLRALQQKEKGFLYLDTHAGRGRYDLAAAARGDSLARKPEWPDGIGRLWDDAAPPAGVADYLAAVRAIDRHSGNLESLPCFYPGSPWLARQVARAQDRLALCEQHPAECAALREEMRGAARVSVHEMDGYTALRAMLPAPERRALVLIDPPFEAQDEFARIADALAEGLHRAPAAVFAVWYPLTERARVDAFLVALEALRPPKTVALELSIAGEAGALKMRGCGVAVVNPPWQFADAAEPEIAYLAEKLAQHPGAGSRVEWIVREA